MVKRKQKKTLRIRTESPREGNKERDRERESLDIHRTYLRQAGERKAASNLNNKLVWKGIAEQGLVEIATKKKIKLRATMWHFNASFYTTDVDFKCFIELRV